MSRFHAMDRGAWRRQVFLGGHPLDCVLSASEERGEVVVAALDEQGFVDVKEQRLVTLRGVVEIRERGE